MSDKETGGPAYPNAYTLPEYQGLTMRDWFAAHASEYDIKRHLCTGRVVEKIEVNGGTKHIYKEAETRTPEQARYCYADAMLEARK